MKRNWAILAVCLGTVGCGADMEAEELSSVTAELGARAYRQDSSPYWVDLFNRHGEPARRFRQRKWVRTGRAIIRCLAG